MPKFPFNWKWFTHDLIAVVCISVYFAQLYRVLAINGSILLFATSFCLVAILSKLYVYQMETIPSYVLFIRTILITSISSSVLFIQIPFIQVVTTFMFLTFVMIGSRMFYQYWSQRRRSKLIEQSMLKKVLIIGAGEAGQLIAEHLKKNKSYNIVGFLDDSYKKIGLRIMSIPVLSEINLLQSTAKKVGATEIFIAIPSLTKERRQEITQICINSGLQTFVMPSMNDIVQGKLLLTKLREVKIEDILARDCLLTGTEKEITQILQQETVLITGAGGSIGSEICRKVLQHNPKKVLLLGHGENSIYELLQQLKDEQQRIEPIIADIRDEEKILDVMRKYKPTIVYHAAAHKHVPLMEQFPAESIKNNIFGTWNVAKAAKKIGVKRFVMISTDKAVDPPNIMGATKRIAEMIIQSLAKNSKTKFAVVRFGNVLGSSGSVVPLFQKQIRQGGPLTITDRRMTRYFMTIPEAAGLVLQASTAANKGEIFILDMGEPVKIEDLAKNMIRLSGYEIDEIGIVETGIRPGEKLHESLLSKREQLMHNKFTNIFVAQSETYSDTTLYRFLKTILTHPENEMRQKLLHFANEQDVKKTFHKGGSL